MLPILFQSHDLIIYSYPLLMGIGWGVGYQLFLARSAESHAFSLFVFWGIFLAAWVGAKVLFLITSPEIDQQFLIQNVNFWTGGGFVFFGGFLSAGIFLLLVYQFRPIKFQTLWAMVPALTIGHAIGRIGCFLAGCCFGKETNWPWSIHLHGADRHPTQLIESFGLFFISWIIWRKKAELKSFAFYFISYGTLRMVVEALRGDDIRGAWGPLSPSQWLSMLLVTIGFSLLIKNKYLVDRL